MYALAVLVVSAVPAVAFLVLILRMDRREPEPLGLVLSVIGLGAAGALAAGIGETALEGASLFQAGGLAGAAAVSFILVAPIEEACKLGVVMLFAWRKPAFNEENDGIVYAGASAVGFALLENILYVVRGGIGTGVMRAFTSIPLHIFTGVVAGLFIGRARVASSRRTRGLLVAAGFLLAWGFHGLYDFFAMSGSALALLVLPLVAGLSTFGVIALKAGRRASLLRWGALRPAVSGEAAPAPPVRRSRAHTWMAVVGRVLLVLSLLFWVLMAVGLADRGTPAGRGDTILGGALITLIPLALGVVLEWSYQAKKRRVRLAAAAAERSADPPRA
jgi:protease PrsW